MIDGFLNRDQRSEALSITERELLNSTFTHTGVGLTITALLAKTMFKNGVTARMMSMNPLMVMGSVQHRALNIISQPPILLISPKLIAILQF